MFTFSQLTLNLWKIGLPLFIFFSVCIKININVQAIILYILTFCLLSLASFIPLFSRAKFKRLDYSKNYLSDEEISIRYLLPVLNASLL